MEDEFFCGHCLEVTTAADYPKVCPHCKVGYCEVCHTRLKADAKYCYGCGACPAPVHARMFRSSSTSGFYHSRSWAQDGLGAGKTRLIGCSRGWDTAEEMHAHAPMKSRWYMDTANADGTAGVEYIRDMTAEEIALIYEQVPS